MTTCKRIIHVWVAALAAGFAMNAAAGITVTQTNLVEPAMTNNPVVSFDVQNEDSVLVVGIYYDNNTPVSNIRFGDGGGVGSGDVAPDQLISSDRGYLAYFRNPSTNSGLAVRADSGYTKAWLFAFWELDGVDLAATVDSGAESITTDKSGEFIIGLGYVNNGGAIRPSASSILQLDMNDDDGGGGAMAGGSATAASAGTHDTSWDNDDGFGSPLTLSFEPIYPPAGTVIVIR